MEYGMHCQACGEIVPGVLICRDCRAVLCKSCYRGHKCGIVILRR